MVWAAFRFAFAADASDCAAIVNCPVVDGLHEVWWDYGRRYQESVEHAMAGKRASAAFSGVLNEAEAHWRLQAATGEGLSLGPNKAARWLDYALVGAFLGVDSIITETSARSDEVAALHTVVDTVLDPSFEVVFRKRGPQLRHESGGAARRWLRRREAKGNLDDVAPPPKPTPPVVVSVSGGWTLRDVDAPDTQPLLGWTAALSVHNAGLTLWRADVDLLSLRWDVLARQRIVDRVAAGVSLHSEDRGAQPSRWSASISWTPRRRLVVTAMHSAPIDDTSWRAEVTVRLELGTFLPGRLDPSLGGLPAAPPSGPNQLTTWSRTPTSTP
ncbi:MAG: hypothetical protein EXR71_04975 [Myxococcales bacterium]|nr:hypothetical protein [Myxococcales bacterium]